MYCVGCGAALQAGQSFCAGCGKATGSVAPAVPAALLAQNRLEVHLRPLAFFWFAISVFHMIPGLVLVIFFGTVASFLPTDLPGFVLWILQFIGFAFLAVSGVGIIAGWGLLERKPWARTLAILLGVISLLNVPFGTALGVYTLWVLLPAQL
jgi:hypothetical protein